MRVRTSTGAPMLAETGDKAVIEPSYSCKWLIFKKNRLLKS